MIVFQYLFVPVLCLLLLLEVIGAWRGRNHRMARLLRCSTWIAAAVAIANPNLTNYAAQAVGIQRGADLVSYGAVLTLIGLAFFGYSRYLRLEQQVTCLTRRLAMMTAQRGPGMPANAQGAPAESGDAKP